MLITLLGISTEVKLAQPEKAFSTIKAVPSFIPIEVFAGIVPL